MKMGLVYIHDVFETLSFLGEESRREGQDSGPIHIREPIRADGLLEISLLSPAAVLKMGKLSP